MHPRVLMEWRRTRYEAAGVVAWIGVRSTEFDARLACWRARMGIFVSPCNPHGRRMPPRWNHRAMRRLQAAARRVPCWTGQGVGRHWREDHCLLACDPRRALVLARRFRQLGVVAVPRGQAARIILLRSRSENEMFSACVKHG